MSRRRKRRSGRPVRRPVRETTTDQAEPVWVDVGGGRMFVVGFTPGGAPYGVFEDEIDAVLNDLDAGGFDQPY